MSHWRAKTLDLGCFIGTRVVRDHTKRMVFERFEPERQALRYIIRNTTLPPRVRAEAQLQLAQMSNYTRPTQIRNRCILGGRTRGVLRDFKMKRYNFRLEAMAGNIPGVKRASW
ncbi:37S ribosomal protein-like protein [Hapsidospora chrysogenum ATCC 11550]|uniref:37S ribosomal protein-like protein n=1 Tax=Hapsidospora chrysogenum (strain ATCC 11550 / CBS 779.69 / DSM 880 / IAM 14645 / JCM 23072 / IMI 49137) TaxID=857340 RepID=A0A086T891_HAPC1|nr:37S ribosomal protein-like protein [Hapsidospora chrysogenum ATCC 11550]